MLHYSSQLANALSAQEDIDLSVVLARETNTHLFSPDVRIKFVDVVTGTDLRQMVSAPRKLIGLPAFLRTIEETKPDIVHLNISHPWFIPTMPVLTRRYRVVATVHDVRPHPGLENTFRKRIERKVVMKHAHKMFVHGEDLKRQLLEKVPFRSPDDVHVTPLGGFYFFTKWVSDVEREEKTVLFFGRIRDYKGLEYLLEAATKIVERVPGVRFLIAGEGNLRPYRNLFSESSTFDIHNRYVPDEEVAAFFQRACLVVLPYIEASQSGIVPIAYSFRLPVVATTVGCIPEAVDPGVTGILVPPRNPAALAEAVIDLLANREKRERMGKSGYSKLLAELGWSDIALRTVEVYNELLRRPVGSGHKRR